MASPGVSMRRLASIAVGCSLSLFACGGGEAGDDNSADNGDADTTTDADAQDAGDEQSDDATPPDAPLDPPARGFQVRSPDIVIAAGEEKTLCYYFRTPNTEALAINRFVSNMTPGSHHMIMYRTSEPRMPDGTVSEEECSTSVRGTDFAQWIYAASQPTANLPFPADDGAGKPLAIDIPAGTPMFIQMHYLNASDDPLTVNVTLNAEALEAGVAYTKTAAYITFNGNIFIPHGSVGLVESASCESNANAKFWMMSTHAHKQAVKTRVLDGAVEMYSDTDWEHPVPRMFMEPDQFFTFTNRISYECTYNNNTGRAIETGDSAQTDEMCMAVGYYFKTAGSDAVPRVCYTPKNSTTGNGVTFPSWNQ